MTTPQPSPSAQLPAPPALARPGNGLGVAALVLGVASLVVAVSFSLFPWACSEGWSRPSRSAILGPPPT